MRNKLLALSLLSLASVSMWGQKDVTSTYLQNAGFDNESDFVTGSICTYAKDVTGNGVVGSSLQAVTGWTADASGDAHAGGCFGLGSGYWVASSGMTVPATDAKGNSAGGTLALAGCWDSNPSYSQALTLPAGSYKIEICGFNAGTATAFGTQTFGFAEEGGTTHYISVTWTVNNWVTASTTFELSSETSGKFIVGAKKVAGGSASSAKLFIDYVKIIDLNAVDKTALNAAIESAMIQYQAGTPGAEEFNAAIEAAKAINEKASATVEEVVNAQDALAKAVIDYEYAAATPESPISMTNLIANPSFESGNLNGWTNNGMQIQSNNSFDKKAGTYYAEKWQGSGGLPNSSILQTINNIPNGYYKITAAAGFDGKGAYVVANSDQTEFGANGDYYVITNVTNHSLEIGIKLISSTSNYVRFDNFRIEYTKSDPATYAAKLALQQQIDIATNLSSKHSAASEQALQEALISANAVLSTGTDVSDFDEATAALASVIAAVNASIADYANLNAQIAIAEAYKVVKVDNAADYAQAIADAQAVYNAGTADNCSDAIAALDAVVKAAKVNDYTYVSESFQYSVSLDEKAWKTTGYVANFSNEHWSGTTHEYKNQDDSNGRGWNSSTGFTIGLSQDVTLPAGKYVFKACGRKSAGATMELSVKAGDTDLGTVSDFPNGNATRGINKNGETSFDEGNEAYANNGNGFGWQWRFVEFELTEETTINVSVKASATVAHEWASFGDYAVLTDNEANLAMITYNVALNSAKTAIANDAYKNVTGIEKVALQNAIDADMTGKSKAEIEAAATALKEVSDNFIAAAPAYDAYVSCMANVDTLLDAAGKAKFAELEADIETELSAATIASVPASYIEAVKAQITPGADMTGIIANAAIASTEGWSNARTNANEQYTGAPDNTYFDVYNETRDIQQNIGKLNAGIYTLKCATRASAAMKNGNIYVLQNGANLASTDIHTDGNTGGELGNGWSWTEVTFAVADNTNDITIGFYSECGGNQWAGADNFSLTYAGDGVSVTIPTSGYCTFSCNVALAVPTGVEVYYASDCDDSYVKMTQIEDGKIPANTGVVLKGTAQSYKLTPATGATAVTGNLLVAATTAIPELAPEADGKTNYVLVNGEFCPFTGTANVAAGKAYLALPNASAGALTLVFDGDATAINAVSNTDLTSGKIYNLNGQAVDANFKGIVIKNGKKILNK